MEFFPRLLPFWSSCGLSSELLAAHHALVARRGATARRAEVSPSVLEEAQLAAEAARRWARGTPPKVHHRSTVIRHIHQGVAPALAATRWQRFLEFERALLDAAATDDVLFGASALRALLEEVGRLGALDLDEAAAVVCASASDGVSAKRLRQFLSAAWSSVRVVSKEEILEEEHLPEPRKRIRLTKRAEAARGALNGFVHPNYGSHMAVLYPEGPEAARVILEGVTALYEALAALSFSAEVPAPLEEGVALGAERASLVERFILGPLASFFPQTPGSPPVPFSTESFTERLSRPDNAIALATAEGHALLATLPTDAAAQKPVTWAGANLDDAFLLALARRSEAELREQFPGGPPDRQQGEHWIEFNVKAMTLAILAAQAKLAAVEVQLVRQIVQARPLGMWLATRLLVEQWALVSWLPGVIEDALDASATSAEDWKVPAAADAIWNSLAQYLTAMADAVEAQPRSWSGADGKAFGRIQLTKVIETVFPPGDFWAKVYSMASGALHGRMLRGMMLAQGGQNASAAALAIMGCARIHADWLPVWSSAIRQLLRLQHAARLDETSGAAPSARWRSGVPDGALVEGRDYAGAGTSEDPIVLAGHIDLHAVSGKLVRQLLRVPDDAEAGAPVRRLERLDGRLMDHWTYDGRQFWVTVNASPERQCPAVASPRDDACPTRDPTPKDHHQGHGP